MTLVPFERTHTATAFPENRSRHPPRSRSARSERSSARPKAPPGARQRPGRSSRPLLQRHRRHRPTCSPHREPHVVLAPPGAGRPRLAEAAAGQARHVSGYDEPAEARGRARRCSMPWAVHLHLRRLGAGPKVCLGFGPQCGNADVLRRPELPPAGARRLDVIGAARVPPGPCGDDVAVGITATSPGPMPGQSRNRSFRPRPSPGTSTGPTHGAGAAACARRSRPGSLRQQRPPHRSSEVVDAVRLPRGRSGSQADRRLIAGVIYGSGGGLMVTGGRSDGLQETTTWFTFSPSRPAA